MVETTMHGGFNGGKVNFLALGREFTKMRSLLDGKAVLSFSSNTTMTRIEAKCSLACRDKQQRWGREIFMEVKTS